MLVGMILGLAAGVRNIKREAAVLNAENAAREAGETPVSNGTKED
jgi:F0F1-type ATP synthase assembly protein I